MEKKIFEFIMSGEEIDKTQKSFEDILIDFKRRQVSSNLLDVLKDKRVVLKLSGTPLPKAFKIIYARDPRDNVHKVFIDVTEIVGFNNGLYVLNIFVFRFFFHFRLCSALIERLKIY